MLRFSPILARRRGHNWMHRFHRPSKMRFPIFCLDNRSSLPHCSLGTPLLSHCVGHMCMFPSRVILGKRAESLSIIPLIGFPIQTQVDLKRARSLYSKVIPILSPVSSVLLPPLHCPSCQVLHKHNTWRRNPRPVVAGTSLLTFYQTLFL